MEKKHGPWIIKETGLKYKNPWIEVREDQVTRPDGKPGIFGVVEMKQGVSVLALDEEGFVYLTEEFHYAIGKKNLEAVSGAIDHGEEPIDAAKRELEEEVGIQAEEWIDLGRVDPFTSVIHSPASLFLARKLKFTKTKQEGTEKIRAKKILLQDAVRMVLESKITHGPSCVLILKAQEYLRSQEKT